jgi:cytochrome P450
MPDEPLPSVFKTTAQDPVARVNPHPRLDRLRNECPVLFDKQMGGFFLTRHADARAILSNRSMMRDPEKALPEARALKMQRQPAPPASRDFEQPPATMLFLDDPDHARIREPFARAFHARISLARPLVTRIVSDALDGLSGKAEFDLVADYAQVIPIRVMSGLIGIPPERSHEFRAWSEAVSLALHPMRSSAATRRMIEGQNALHDYLLDLLAVRRKSPMNDLVSDLAALQANGAGITDRELQANVRLLLVAGNLTTSDLIGSTVLLLLQNRDALEHLKSAPDLISRVVEEALRMESPIDATDRIAPRDMSIRGCPVSKGQALTISLRGANRDADVFDEPHAFRLDRRGPAHVAFGGGAHFCLGAPLARIETQLAVKLLLERMPLLRRADASPIQWRALPPFRGLLRLQVLA